MTVGQCEKPCLIIADSENDADLLYATGFIAPDPFVWYATPNETGIIVNALEVGRARKQAHPGISIRTAEEAVRDWKCDRKPGGPLETVETLSEVTGIKAWHVPETFPFGLAEKLIDRGIQLRTRKPFFPGRETKRVEEIAHIEAGVRLAEAGLARGLEILRDASVAPEGTLHWHDAVLTAEILRGEIDAEIARRGGTASHTITAPGVQGADPHLSGNGPIRENEPIILDIFPRVDATGYFGDLTRTVVKGRAPDIVHRAFEVIARAQAAAMACVEPDVSGKDVHDTAAHEIQKSGFCTDADAEIPYGFFHGTGHGLGLEIHEGPRVSSKSESILQVGNVITIEPGVYYPEWGGVRLEDVVVVTEDGYRNLTVAEKVLEIL